MNSESKVCDLSAALTRMGGNRELLQHVAGFFLEDYPSLMARLKAALDEQNVAGVRQSAHSLKGLVANFDADAAGRCIQQIERAAHANDLTDTGKWVGDLEVELQRLRAELHQQLWQAEPGGDGAAARPRV